MRAGEVYFVNGRPNRIMWGASAPDALYLPAVLIETPGWFGTYRDVLRALIVRRLAAD